KRLGRTRQSDAQTPRQWRVGINFAGSPRRRSLQVRNSRAIRGAFAQERSVRVFQSAGNIDDLPRLQFGTLPMERRRLDGAAPLERVAEESDQHLRSSSRFVATEGRRRKSAVQLFGTRRDAVAVCA